MSFFDAAQLAEVAELIEQLALLNTDPGRYQDTHLDEPYRIDRAEWTEIEHERLDLAIETAMRAALDGGAG